MSLLNYFRRNKETASVAKERLQIIISHERAQHRSGLDYLPKLQKEIVDVIAKYVDIDKEHVKMELDREGENAILELNITLPEQVLAEAEGA